MRPRILLRCLLLLFLLAGSVSGACAQDRPRSDTGRRRTEPPPVEETATAADAAAGTELARAAWLLIFNFGLSGGSDLFRAETVDGFPGPWPGSPFQSSGVYTKLDPGFTFGAGLGRRLGSWFTVRGDLSWSEMNVTGESAVGQVGGTFTYDRFTVYEIVLGVETRLVRQPSAPYLGVGVTLRGISPGREHDLAQTVLGGRLTLGYEHVMGPTWALRVEGRISYGGFSTDGYVPSKPAKEVVVEGEGSLTIWQLLVGVQMDL